MNKISEITILIVLYDETDQIIFKNLEKIKNFKIIIVDNKGDKKLKNRITEKFGISKYYLSNKNLGFSQGFNKALNFCKTKYVFIKNADCYIDEDNIIKLYDYIKNNQNCGIVSPTSYDEYNNLSYNSGKLPENKNSNEILKVEGDVCVEKVLGSSMFVKMEDLQKVGMFNENLFIYFSDDELCKKIRRINKHVVQIYNSKCIHVHGISKVKNKFYKIYLKELYFTLDELVYFKDISDQKINKLKSKIFNYCFKILVSFFALKFFNLIKYYARVVAYIKFKK
jgi:GT2 family glycosyltransferase